LHVSQWSGSLFYSILAVKSRLIQASSRPSALAAAAGHRIRQGFLYQPIQRSDLNVLVQMLLPASNVEPLETDRREGGTGEGVGNACPVRAHAFAAASKPMPDPEDPVSQEPAAPPESTDSQRSWHGLDRLGLIQAIGGLFLGLIALFSSYDHVNIAGRNLPLQQQWGITFILASVATVLV